MGDFKNFKSLPNFKLSRVTVYIEYFELDPTGQFATKMPRLPLLNISQDLCTYGPKNNIFKSLLQELGYERIRTHIYNKQNFMMEVI